MSYPIYYSNEADKILSKIPKNKRTEIIKRISKLSGHPEHFAKQLLGTNLWSLRCGNLRVILEIDKKEKNIFILTLGPRETIYKRRV